MLESELLRKELEETYNIDLEKYKWDEKLKEEILKIKLDKDYEDMIDTMEEVYEYGLNIGSCGLTSRYFAINYPDAQMHIGKCKILIGTKNAPNGEHAWITREDYIIDSTLMLKIPLSEAEQYYKSEKVLAYDSARTLPEYNVYSNDVQKKKSR